MWRKNYFRRPCGLHRYLLSAIFTHAYVDKTARLEDDVTVEPGAVIGPRVEIGSGSVIGANAVIGTDVRIGRDCSIGAGADREQRIAR